MYITHTEWKSSIQVYCSVLFSVFAELCSCQHSHFRTLISLPKNNSPVCISHHSQTPFLFPWQPPIYFLCLWNCLFWTFCIKESSNIWSFMCDFSVGQSNWDGSQLWGGGQCLFSGVSCMGLSCWGVDSITHFWRVTLPSPPPQCSQPFCSLLPSLTKLGCPAGL